MNRRDTRQVASTSGLQLAEVRGPLQSPETYVDVFDSAIRLSFRATFCTFVQRGPSTWSAYVGFVWQNVNEMSSLLRRGDINGFV
jgi:hypothetical protein